MRTRQRIARGLAAALVAGRFETEELVQRGAIALGRRWRWLRPLCSRLVNALGGRGRPLRATVEQFILYDDGFCRGYAKRDLALHACVGPPPQMCPRPGQPAQWQVPAITTAGALADWLGLSCGELEWFADCRSLECKVPAGPLRHYLYHWIGKRDGTARLVEVPKRRLKAIQRRLLHEILDRIAPHEAAHGFRRGRSIGSCAAPHVGQSVVVRLDLRDFFPSISRARVAAIFMTAGYPEPVARLMAGLCTNAVPDEVWSDAPRRGREADSARRLYGQPHLPQGAPASPALANLCAYRLDRRLHGLAAAAGACYTRYADDLIFSGGDLQRMAKRFCLLAASFAIEEGFAVHTRKTRVMRPGVRQHVLGVVVNERANVARDEFDRLKATLWNCVRRGPEGENRGHHPRFREHLAGRISYVALINPQRGKRLRDLFDQVLW